MLKSHDQPTDVSRCAFVLPAVCGDVWFYARLITRVQAAEGGINAEFNVICGFNCFLQPRERYFCPNCCSEICGRVERKPCACATVGLRRPLRSLSTCALAPQPPPPELQRCLELPGCYGADPLLPVSLCGARCGGNPTERPGRARRGHFRFPA